MNAHEYRDDDRGYARWLTLWPRGYVLNIAANLNPSDAKLHQTRCSSIQPRDGKSSTGPYIKVCAPQLADLAQWSGEYAIPLPPRCKACHQAPHMPGAATTAGTRRRAQAPLPDGRSHIDGPSDAGRAVQVWADDYIRHGAARPPWQQDLRTNLRSLVAQLRPIAGEILHATFVGDKPDNSDVENLVLYNIDAFKMAGRNGIRFEAGAVVPPARDGIDYPFYYRYELQPAAGCFRQWRGVRELASFDWTDLGSFTGERKVAQVWLALKRSRPTVAESSLASGAPFAVIVTIRPPLRREDPRPDLLMKAIFDGVIAAFQAHADAAVLADVSARLAIVLPVADPAEIAQHLRDEHRAALGTVEQLVLPQGSAGKWNPGDHWCVAGQLLAVDPVDSRWAIRGRVIEIRPSQ